MIFFEFLSASYLMMVSVMLSTIERASQNWYSCFHPTLNRCINLCFEAGKCWKAGLRLRMKYGSAICLGQEISSELLDQFGARILLILIQIYKSGVPNWLPSQNTSHPISHVSRQARVVSMADDTRDDFTKNKHNPQEHSPLNSNKITRVPSRGSSRGQE